MNAFERLYDIHGSRARLAAKIGVTPEAVRKWEQNRIPAERCKDVVRVSYGQITLHDLRPDLWSAPSERAA